MSITNERTACALETLDREQRADQSEPGEWLFPRTIEWRAPPDALELRPPADDGTPTDLSRFILLEEVCCPFHTLEIGRGHAAFERADGQLNPMIVQEAGTCRGGVCAPPLFVEKAARMIRGRT